MFQSDLKSNHENACEFLTRNYPETAKAVSVSQALSPSLVSPHQLKLPKKVLDQAQSVVRAFFELRMNNNYVSQVETQQSGDLALNKNFGALMSYDFHLDESGALKLIEINTNASSSLIVDLQYRRMNLASACGGDFQHEIIETFKEEFSLFSEGKSFTSLAIIDHEPQQQKMYIEFLMYAELFRRAGIEVVIGHPSDFELTNDNRLKHKTGLMIDLVYNRHTDFYFLASENENLRSAYRSLTTCFTPNPREYALLADKQRLQEISKEGFLESLGISSGTVATIRSVLLKSFSINEFAPDDLWSQRKKFFFKPARAFGGKAAYRGASISRGPFEQLFQNDTIAQEYVPAPEIMLPVEGGGEANYKFDLRFYAYKDRVQLCNARVYQGQTTNATTPGGGLTPLVYI